MNEAFNAAMRVSGYGLAGIFGFMLLFYGAIKLIMYWFPADDAHHEER
jgi:hypothetical protein